MKRVKETGSWTSQVHSRSPPKQLFCPECSSTRLYKDDLRYLADGSSVQRWLCRDCYYRFSEKKPLQEKRNCTINTASAIVSKRQVCELLARASKNLTEVARQEQPTREGTQQTADAKGKIVEFQWFLKKKGRSELTVNHVGRRLTLLAEKNVDLLNPEELKNYLVRTEDWSVRTKVLTVSVYDGFLKFLKISWDAPEYKPDRKPVFVPTKEELECVISGVGKKLSVFLRILEETALRFSECCGLLWTDVDFQRRLITVTSKKHGNFRILPISQTLADLLVGLPRKSEKLFPATRSAIHSNYYIQRKKLAVKLGNQRLLKIGFHTFRHYKLTMLAHEIRDPFYMPEFAGHRDIKSTMLYIHLEKQIFHTGRNEDYHVATARTVEEASKIVAVGFEFVHEYQGVMIYRKRK